MSHQSLSANDKADNEMIPGAVHRSPVIYFRAEENPRNSQLGDQMRIGSQSTSGMEKGHIKECG